MLYASRDDQGKIIAITNSPVENNQTELTEAELIEFISHSENSGTYETLLTILDTGIIRVLDDLVDILVAKNVIMFTDLPQEAREKIAERKRIRQQMKESNELMVDDIL